MTNARDKSYGINASWPLGSGNLAGRNPATTAYPNWQTTLAAFRKHIADPALVLGPNARPVLSGISVTISTSNSADTPVINLYTDADVFLSTGGRRFTSVSAWRMPVTQLTDVLSGGNSGDPGYASVVHRHYVETNSDYVTFIIRGTVEPFRFIVNDQYIDLDGTVLAASGTIYFATLDLTPVKGTKVVGVEGQSAAAFRGVAVATGASLNRPSSAFRMLWAGDSFIAGVGTPTNLGNCVGRVAADYLSIRNTSLSGNAGTGWRSKGSGNDRPYLRQRIADIINTGPWDIISIPMGTNDISDINSALFTLDDVRAEIRSCLDILRTTFPSALLLLMGVWDQEAPSAPRSGYAELKAAMIAETLNRPGVFFVDMEGITYEKLGGGDVLHPSVKGHKEDLGPATARRIKEVLSIS